MHELSIATSLADHVVEVARQQGAVRIDEVEVEVGILQQIVPEALEVAFAAVTAGTLAEGAALKLVSVEAVAECRLCERRFEPTIEDYLCPACRRADVRIVEGDDIVLKSVVCQVRENASRP